MQNGNYTVRNNIIQVSGSVDGKQYRKSTKKEATPANLKWIEKNAYRVLLNIIDEEKPKRSEQFKEFALSAIELSSYKRDKHSQNDYISKLNNHILPYFKNFLLSDIKPDDIERWQITLMKKLSSSSVKRCRSILNMVLHRAVGNDMILKNPCDFADKISPTYGKKEPYSIDEMLLLLKHSDGWLRKYLYLAFTTGMRTGELLALQPGDFDFERNIIYISRSISKGIIKESNKLKNHNRIAIVPKTVMDMFKDCNSEFIFPTRLGGAYKDSKTIVKYWFKPLLEKVGVSYKTLYATRHTFISLLRNQGVDKNFIQELVGHSADSNVTDKHYTTFEMNDTKYTSINNVFMDLNLYGNDAELAQS